MQFVFDLDGTLCFKGMPLSSEIDAALKALNETHTLTIASARPIRDIYPVIPTWMRELNLVGGNGALVKTGNVTTATCFEDFSPLAQLLDHYPIDYLADSEWDYAYTGAHDHHIFGKVDELKLARNHTTYRSLPSIIKLVMMTDHPEILQAIATLPVEAHIYHNEALIDISPAGITKYRGVQALGIDEFIAFGNDANDISLFEHACESICVGTHPKAAACATRTIDSTHVAQTILEYC
ncbi:HAD-IIB family hydrolase [Wohlfahrtiimonas sp. G9077]|uniref:HAD-IIB family hydrolase n=1 Tax=Wohlfahrtiimonas sp. G9077 TaxID=1980118 RepID=UPI000B9854DB|nr:HAD-IIB family hydrolase [Wohlfahrtiimonas sp. G9077]OYQ73371.1 hypothetical protein B9T20_06545 [Wohlfahrtiimonas sp. G9077]